MAKSKKTPAKKLGGPFLAVAAFCENIMEDARGVVSAIGIIDGIQIALPQDAPADFPSAENPIEFLLNVLVAFRTGGAPGKHQLKLVSESPIGKRKEVGTKEFELSGDPQGGINIKNRVNMKMYTAGIFWIDVILDGKRLTRMPFKVDIQRAEATPLKKK